jgi:hypothetical protein
MRLAYLPASQEPRYALPAIAAHLGPDGGDLQELGLDFGEERSGETFELRGA